jgi:hypothetical protein
MPRMAVRWWFTDLLCTGRSFCAVFRSKLRSLAVMESKVRGTPRSQRVEGWGAGQKKGGSAASPPATPPFSVVFGNDWPAVIVVVVHRANVGPLFLS